MNQPVGAVGSLTRHFIRDGVVALFVAVGRLVLLRGVDARVLLLFIVPPLVAFLILQRATTNGSRRVAMAFLVLVAVGALIEPFPAILPNLGGIDQGLPRGSDRLLTWYAVVYCLFIMGIVPTYFVVANLRCHWRGEPADVSRLTCYLGLLPLVLIWPVLPVMLGALLGLWPFPR